MSMSEAQRTRKGKPVEVDQRELINKVLARYPGDFTLFRELLQNSDDAESSTVEIHFVTAGSSQHERNPPIPSEQIVQWIFKNDGKPFTDKDWRRLTRIAMGNPYSKKVGAFGIGFYSLFSVTDGPIVSSDGQVMEFYWNEDQLFFQLEGDHAKDKWTVFKVPLRVPAQLPPVVDFMQFLATSLVFMAHLNQVRLFLDERCIGKVKKYGDSFETLDLPISLKRPTPNLDMNVVSGLQRHQFTVQAEISAEVSEPPIEDSSNSQSETVSQPTDSAPSSPIGDCAELELTVFTVEVDIETNKELSYQLSRCMGKKPPSQVKYSLVYTGKDEYDRSSMNQQPQSLKTIFQGIRADLGRTLHSKIFIGQPTSQTTGIGGHMASQFIPTSERESVDLADSNVAIWNSALLHIGGFLCRAVYELELTRIDDAWIEFHKIRDPNPREFYRTLHNRFIHVLKFFSFHSSTPSQKVAEQLKKSFYTCSASPPRLLSSVGVRSASDIRLFDELCDRFLKHIPMLVSDVAEERFIKALPPEHQIRPITVSDVDEELRNNTLDEGEIIACIQWILRESSTGTNEPFQLIRVARFKGGGGISVELSTIKQFIDISGLGIHIPPHGPLPPFLLPRHITQQFRPPARLKGFGWQEFTIVDWLRHISGSDFRAANQDYDFSRSIVWAERVLHSVSSALSSSSELVDLAKEVLTGETCIPTTCGLCKPEDSYLPSSKMTISDDERFPIVRFSSVHGTSEEMERLLKDLGVNQHLPPRFLIQLMKDGKMNTFDLVDYLIHVASSFSDANIQELGSSDVFEGFQGTSKGHYHINELYPPFDIFQRLRLPIIDFGPQSRWQDSSPGAKILYRLGLRRFPPLNVIISLCSPDSKVRGTAFDFLCKNHRTLYSDSGSADFEGTALIPADKNGVLVLEKPGDVFLDQQWKTLGFSVVQTGYPESVLDKLGVQRHPPSTVLCQMLLEHRHSSEEGAHLWFETLSYHVTSFSIDQLKDLSQSPIVPKSTPGGLKWLTPVQCYLKRGPKHDLYSKLFHFVDFGNGENFLRACRAKNEPSEEDIAKTLVEDPKKFYKHAEEPKRFMEELCDLATRRTHISNDIIGKMKLAPILLGVQRQQANPDGGQKDVYSLFKPSEIVIVDDVQTFRQFSDSVIAAPRDMHPKLEEFYRELGSNNLTQVVRDEGKVDKEIPDSQMCSHYEHLIRHKLPLFLDNSSRHPCEVNNIAVSVCEKLFISQTLRIGGKKIPKEREAWATTIYKQGTLHVWLSESAKPDMYELATSLCRVLFDGVNINDALLLSNILSEDIEVLKRRGYEESGQTLGRQQTPATSGTISSDTSTNSTRRPALWSTTGAGSNIKESDSYMIPGDHVDAPDSTTSSGRLSILTKSVNTLANVVGLGSAIHASFVRVGKQSEVRSLSSSWDPRQVMTRRYLDSMVEKSIQACHPGHQVPSHHRGGEDMMNYLNNGYCEELTENFKSLRIGDVDVYISEDTPEALKENPKKQDRVDHFARIIHSIAEIYGLPAKSWCIFYNTTAGRIAFNRRGSLYLNLRYFELWHYQDVKKGNRGRALSSWFLTIAHEIAHNVVKDHNAEHEFWFWAVCDAHMDKLSRLLARTSASDKEVQVAQVIGEGDK